MKAPKLPVLQLILMAIFSIGGPLLILMDRGIPAVAGLSLPVFIVCYLGYPYIIIACIIHYFSRESGTGK